MIGQPKGRLLVMLHTFIPLLNKEFHTLSLLQQVQSVSDFVDFVVYVFVVLVNFPSAVIPAISVICVQSCIEVKQK